MRVLITGGFGYLGSRIAQYLDSSGFFIFLGSREKRVLPQWMSRARVEKLEWERIELLEDVCAKVDCIVHCAGMNAEDCKTNPRGALDFNGEATSRLVSACEGKNVKKFILYSPWYC